MLDAGSARALPSSMPAPSPREKRPSTACTTSGKRLGLVTSKVTTKVRPVPPTLSTCALLGVMVGGLGLAQAALRLSTANSTNCRELTPNEVESMVRLALSMRTARRRIAHHFVSICLTFLRILADSSMEPFVQGSARHVVRHLFGRNRPSHFWAGVRRLHPERARALDRGRHARHARRGRDRRGQEHAPA